MINADDQALLEPNSTALGSMKTEARRGLQPRRLRFVRSHSIRHGTKRCGRDYKSRPALITMKAGA